jgi:hypothetical protein
MSISAALQKDVGERPHAFRLDRDHSNILQEFYQTDESVNLKKNAEKVAEKMEIIGLNLISA